MDARYKVVVLISKKLIRAAQVEKESIIDPIEMEWAPELLRKAVSVIKTRYQTSHIRVIMDEDVSHALDLEIPASTSSAEERETILSKIQTQIPEVLSAENWDYKVKETKGDVKIVTVFVPVQETYLSLTDAAAKEGVEIDATEPISASLARNPNPFVGMAQKTDLRGEDSQVLNVQPLYKVEESSGSLESVQDLEKKKSPNKIILLSAGLLLFGLLSYGVVAAVRNTAAPKVSPSPSPTPVISTPTPSPTPAPVDLETLKLKILNGSGVTGQAGVVGKLLQAAGFASSDTGNAANYDFTDTVVQLKPSVSTAAYDAVVKALQPDYSVKEGTPLAESNDFDVIVTVGKKASALGAATTAPSATPKASFTPKPSLSPSPSASSSAL